MKKKIFLIIISIVLIFSGWSTVRSDTDVNSYTQQDDPLESASCTTGACMSSTWYKPSKDSEARSLYGVRVSLVKADGANVSVAKVVNFWASQAMSDSINTLKMINSDLGYFENIYDANVGLKAFFIIEDDSYSEYISSLSVDQVKRYISVLGGVTFAQAVEKNYYLKFEPIYVLRFSCNNKLHDTCTNKVYYIGGTSREILTAIQGTLLPGTSDTGARYYANAIVKKSTWNVIRDFITSTYIDKAPDGSDIAYYTHAAVNTKTNTQLYEIYQTTDSGKGLGVGYVKVSQVLPQEGTLIINKTDNLDRRISNVTFGIFSNPTCEGPADFDIDTQNGTATTSLPVGNYCVQEIGYRGPSDHFIPDASKKSFAITPGGTTTVDFTNTLTCQGYLDVIVGEDGVATTLTEKQNLIKLYEGTYVTNQEDFSNYRNLLNFSSPSCTPVTVTTSHSKSCLSAQTKVENSETHNTDFSENNLSLYTDDEEWGKIPIAGATASDVQYAYCMVEFKLENNLEVYPNVGTKINYNTVSKTFYNVKPGQSIVKFTSPSTGTTDPLATGILTRTCYDFSGKGTETDFSLSNDPGDFYGYYVSTPEFQPEQQGNKKLAKQTLRLSSITLVESHNNNVKFFKYNSQWGSLGYGQNINLYNNADCYGTNHIYKGNTDKMYQNAELSKLKAENWQHWSNLALNDCRSHFNKDKDKCENNSLYFSVYERNNSAGATNVELFPSNNEMTDEFRGANRCTTIKVGTSGDSVGNEDNIGVHMSVIKVGYWLGNSAAYNQDGSRNGVSNTETNAKGLTYGLYSNYNTTQGTYKMNFDIGISGFGTASSTSDCFYKVIDRGVPKDEVVFRTVQTDEEMPFYTKGGTGTREPGQNWSLASVCEEVLKNHNNGYNKNNEEPKYKITLTPALIQKIRNYNKDNSYNDYNFTCNAASYSPKKIGRGNVCISNYLTSLNRNEGLQIIDSYKRDCLSNSSKC